MVSDTRIGDKYPNSRTPAGQPVRSTTEGWEVKIQAMQ